MSTFSLPSVPWARFGLDLEEVIGCSDGSGLAGIKGAGRPVELVSLHLMALQEQQEQAQQQGEGEEQPTIGAVGVFAGGLPARTAVVGAPSHPIPSHPILSAALLGLVRLERG